jgi:hypothetical protein
MSEDTFILLTDNVDKKKFIFHKKMEDTFILLSDEKQHAIYRRTMFLLTDRVDSSTSRWDIIKPLLASEMRILEEKMNDAFTQYKNAKMNLEAHYVESRKKHPDEVDYEFSESLRLERNRLESIYNKYADKHARELARKEDRLEEYDWERQQEMDQEWDDYNHNVSMYVDCFLH